MDSDILGNVQGEGRFTHRWTGSDDDQIVPLESGGDVIKVTVARRNSCCGAIIVVQLLDVVIDINEDILDAFERT